MGSQKEACVLCAWRESCQKRFSLSGKDVRCPDFVRDMSIREEADREEKKTETSDRR